MAKIVARNASLGIDDIDGTLQALSGDSNQVSLSFSAETPDVTSFGDAFHQRLSDGLKDWEVGFNAKFNTSASKVDDVLFRVWAGSTLMTFGPAGSAGGSIKYTACAILSEYNMTFGVEGAGEVTGTIVARSGSMTRGTY